MQPNSQPQSLTNNQVKPNKLKYVALFLIIVLGMLNIYALFLNLKLKQVQSDLIDELKSMKIQASEPQKVVEEPKEIDVPVGVPENWTKFVHQVANFGIAVPQDVHVEEMPYGITLYNNSITINSTHEPPYFGCNATNDCPTQFEFKIVNGQCVTVYKNVSNYLGRPAVMQYKFPGFIKLSKGIYKTADEYLIATLYSEDKKEIFEQMMQTLKFMNAGNVNSCTATSGEITP